MAGNLVWIPILGVVILIIYSAIIQGPLKQSIEEGSRLASQKYANLIESLSGLETLKLFGAQSQFQFKWEEAVAHVELEYKKSTNNRQYSQHGGFVQQASNVGMIILGVYLIADGEHYGRPYCCYYAQ